MLRSRLRKIGRSWENRNEVRTTASCLSPLARLRQRPNVRCQKMKRNLTIVVIALLSYAILMVALFAPRYREVRDMSRVEHCCNNLAMIRSAIDYAATVNRWEKGDPAQPQVFTQYLRNKHLPVCPSGGTYCIRPVGENPTCSIHGDSLKSRFVVFTMRQLKQLKGAADLYRLDCGAFPSEVPGLSALMTNPGISNWHGPYMLGKEIPEDSWGNAFWFSALGTNITIISAGPDGKPGTADDIQE